MRVGIRGAALVERVKVPQLLPIANGRLQRVCERSDERIVSLVLDADMERFGNLFCGNDNGHDDVCRRIRCLGNV